MEQRREEKCGIRLLYTCSPIELEGKTQVGCFRFQMGRLLGKYAQKGLAGLLDYIVPVPNSGLYYAMGAAESLKVPYLQSLVKRDGHKRTLQETDLQMRERLITENITLLPGLLEGKRIALVDEAIFTGTTLKMICRMLKGQGVASIHILIPTSICATPCPQGEMPQRDLLVHHIPSTEFGHYFGAASVTFLPYDKMRRFTDSFQPVCLECFRQEEP